MNKITVELFEQKVFRLEGIRLIIRAPKTTLVKDYVHLKKTKCTSTVNTWLKNKIIPCLENHEYEVIAGSRGGINTWTTIDELRNRFQYF